MHVFYAPDIAVKQELPEEEAMHCLRVLRLSQGDEIMLTDGAGYFYKAVIVASSGRRCVFAVREKTFQSPLWRGHLHVAMAPTKSMDRIEWFAEKATEIGVDELTFVDTRFSERKVVRTDRIEKIVVSAVKQSLKARKPRVNGMIAFDRFVGRAFQGQKFIAYCGEGEKPHLKDLLNREGDALVLIGPEGDFSPEEVGLAIANDFRPVSLGESRLRTETAALVACHIMNLYHQS